MRFEAFDLSLLFIRRLEPVARRLRTRDAELHRQLRRAASSISLNLAEGAGRSGNDRRHHYRIAAGSAREADAALQVAEAWGELQTSELRGVYELLERLHQILWRLVH